MIPNPRLALGLGLASLAMAAAIVAYAFWAGLAFGQRCEAMGHKMRSPEWGDCVHRLRRGEPFPQ